jgi:NADPH-dependent 2,4-dienoyl-CoA reductase/sulfur reductase-like enzyme
MYGGQLKNRMRFALEVIENIRSKVGDSFPISFRISGCEYLSGGITLEEAKQTAIELEKAGIDTIHVSGGTHETVYAQIIPMYLPRGYNIHLAEAIKKVVNIPVIAAGAINDPMLANEIIEDKKADLISMARPLLADPYLPTKAKEGRIEDIRKCIRCNECVQRLRELKSFGCAINPEVGKEERYRIKSGLQRKRILVVGGGPAGLEAARVAALRGHTVTLCEKQDMLGGNLIAASVPQFKNELRNLIEYYTAQLKKLGVRILLGKEVTCSTVRELASDAVIVGVGSEPIIPDIPGVDKPFAVTATDVLTGKAKVGKKIIVVGAGSVGSETAWFLAEQGKDITIIEMLDEIPVEMERACKMVLLDQFAKYDVKMIPGVKLEEIRDSGVVVIDKNWKRRVIEGDTVVLALGLKPRTVLVEEFKKTFPNVYPIGDCVQARKIFEAIQEGAHIARQI